MADLLGSILGSMEKPPSASKEELKRKKGTLTTRYAADILFIAFVLFPHTTEWVP